MAVGAPPVNFRVYLNVLGIIVLAKASKPFSEVPSQEAPEALGIDIISEVPEAESAESEAGDDPFL